VSATMRQRGVRKKTERSVDVTERRLLKIALGVD
jgi:hypothetical protein